MKVRKLKLGIIYAIILVILVELDLFTKRLAVAKLSDGPVVVIKGVLEFRYLQNTGAAFSMLNNARTFFLIITAIFFVAAVWFFIKIPVVKKYRYLRILLVFITAGAAGNFIDRLTLNYVRDFIYFSLIDFPIFNVADIYVTCAVILLVLYIIFTKDEFEFIGKPKKKED